MKRLLTCAFLLTIILAGCGSGSDETVCKIKQGQNKMITTVNTIEHKSGEVSMLKMENTIDLSKIEKLKEKELKEYAKAVEKVYKEIDGVDYAYSSSDKKFNETITIELNDKTIKSVKKSGILAKYLGEKDEKVKAKALIKQFEKIGMKCE